ncbi:MAG: hypothetical protein LBG97_09985, partial [Coriobacteriales bacterium]|nr:hypothetical protein [Coriobacteriales bacterium]
MEKMKHARRIDKATRKRQALKVTNEEQRAGLPLWRRLLPCVLTLLLTIALLPTAALGDAITVADEEGAAQAAASFNLEENQATTAESDGGDAAISDSSADGLSDITFDASSPVPEPTSDPAALPTGTPTGTQSDAQTGAQTDATTTAPIAEDSSAQVGQDDASNLPFLEVPAIDVTETTEESVNAGDALVQSGDATQTEDNAHKAGVSPMATSDLYVDINSKDITTYDASTGISGSGWIDNNQLMNVHSADPGPQATSRTITISFNNAIVPVTVAGFVNKGGQSGYLRGWHWVFDATTLPEQLKLAVTGATWTPNPRHTMFDNNHFGAGTFVYTIADGTGSLDIPLLVKAQFNEVYTLNSGVAEPHGLSVPGDGGAVIDVRARFNDGTTNIELVSQLTDLKINANSGTRVVMSSPGGTLVSKPGDTGTMSIRYGAWHKSNYGGTFYATDVVAHYAMDKRLNADNVRMGTSQQPNSIFEYTWNRTISATHDILTVHFNGTVTADVWFSFDYSLDQNLPAGWFNGVTSVGGVSDIPDNTFIASMTLWNGKTYTQDKRLNGWGIWGPSIFISAYSVGKLDCYYTRDKVGFQDPSNPGNLLNYINLREVHGVSMNGYKARLDFTDYAGKAGVTGIFAKNIAGGNPTVTDVAVYSTAGKTYTLTSVSASSGFRITSAGLGMADGEYIATINYTYNGTISPLWYNAGGNTDNLGYAAVIVYGVTLGASPTQVSYDTTAEFTDITQNITDTASESYLKQTWTTTSAKATTAYAQAGVNQLTTTMFAGRSFRDVRFDAWGATVIPNGYASIVYKGFTWYLRQGGSFIFSRSSFKVNGPVLENGVEQWGLLTELNGGLIVTQGTDNTGDLYWKITAPNVWYCYNNSAYAGPITMANPRLMFDCRVNPAAEYKKESLWPYFACEPSDPNLLMANGSGDTFNLTGLGSNHHLAYVSGEMITIPSTAFTAELSARTGMDYNVYDWTSGATITDITKGTVTYEQRLSLYSGGNEINSAFAMIPIPKKGESVPGRMPASPSQFSVLQHLQQNPFQFSAYLAAPVNAPAGYSVLYNTSYTTDIHHGGWKDFNAIPNTADIKMILIQTTQSWPVGKASDFIDYTLALSETNESALRTAAGTFDAYAAWFGGDLVGTQPPESSSAPCAVRMATGSIEGLVFNDNNKDGVWGLLGGDTVRAGVKVAVLEAGTTNELDSDQTDSMGFFKFEDLDTPYVDVVITNPDTTANTWRFSPASTAAQSSMAV